MSWCYTIYWNILTLNEEAVLPCPTSSSVPGTTGQLSLCQHECLSDAWLYIFCCMLIYLIKMVKCIVVFCIIIRHHMFTLYLNYRRKALWLLTIYYFKSSLITWTQWQTVVTLPNLSHHSCLRAVLPSCHFFFRKSYCWLLLISRASLT